MAKPKLNYQCNDCGAMSSKWAGQCPDCEAWNTIIEVAASFKAAQSQNPRFKGFTGQVESVVTTLSEIAINHETRVTTGQPELDRVLGGGLVMGSVILIGGDPGIGKSTVLLQTLSELSAHNTALYVTGEESLHQVKLRAQRLEVPSQNLCLLTETNVERIIQLAQIEKPQVMVIDSIQTMHTELLQSAPGGVSQVRESAAQLVRFAKQSGTALFLVGHVTKEGTLAGPRVLEHMVDTVLYFEGDKDSRFRIIRAVKNRFGAVNELGVFAMTEKGLKGINNPSAIFLTRVNQQAPGSVVMVCLEGTRPLLVEVQALVDTSFLSNPRRVTVGLEQNRLALVLAVLHRHGGIASFNQDVFVNVVGGVRVTETASDLAVALAVVSSLKNKPFSYEAVVFGEIGLSGEIRPVQNGQDRLKDAAKHGFKHAIVPKANLPKTPIENMEVIGVNNLEEALQVEF
ncbi:MAG: repair protein RadA [Francisellaceae bacterium]|nr:repair protein RadA [Francisellaceae bacterium]